MSVKPVYRKSLIGGHKMAVGSCSPKLPSIMDRKYTFEFEHHGISASFNLIAAPELSHICMATAQIQAGVYVFEPASTVPVKGYSWHFLKRIL
jgi:hypothetical protein